MPRSPRRLVALLAPLVLAPLGQTGAQVVINEIMYHPPHADGDPEPTGEEFVELLNAGTGVVSLDGWELDRGVDFTLGAVSLEPGETLVIAADLVAFQTAYPGVTNAVGDWTGRLSNSGEEVRLRDALGNTIDSLAYADQGDWAARVRERIGGEDGWAWGSPADGGGRSLELRNPALTNKSGQNWAPSPVDGGSPGAANPSASNDLPPLIRDVEHAPPVPRSTDTVQIEADIVDETPGGELVTLHWRTSKLDPQDEFVAVSMEDNNGNGRWEADLPALPNGTVVEFYIEASDGNATRTWPAPTDEGQVANCLYQVDDETISAPSAAYRLIMSVEEDAQFTDINRQSDAQMNTTLVADDGSGPSVRYLCGNRVRGAGSRGRDPISHRINIPRDTPWNGITRMNLNAQYTWLQFTGMKLFTASGLPAPETRRVQVRRNGVNFADGRQQNYGSYVHVEPLGGEFVDNHLPDNGGDLYKKVRPDVDWAWREGDFARYAADGWSKSSNSAAADWTGLDEFLRVMNEAAGDPDYIEQVEAVADLDQWMRWFATMALLANGETNPSTGTDDDYSMYRGELDPRFIFVPHDLDTVLGRGDGSAITETDSTLFDMIEPGANGRNDVLDPLVPLFEHPQVRTRYFEALRELAQTSFSKRRFDELVRNNLTGWVPDAEVDAMIAWMDGRRAFVLQEAEDELGPAPPPDAPTSLETMPAPAAGLRLNEVLAKGSPDAVELHNPEIFPLDLGGFVIESDSPGSTPFVIPPGTVAPGMGEVSFTSDELGFNLDADGGTLTLRRGTGQVEDTLAYGLQISGHSISRVGNNGDTWALTTPTIGTPNAEPKALGDPAGLRINEWLAQADYRFKRDYIELFNPVSDPVALGGIAITDDAINDRSAFTLPPLSFIAADGYQVFHAVGGDAVQGEWDELPFRLSLDHEWVTLIGSNGVLIDQVHFLQQRPDVAEGRTPDGGGTYERFGLATPDLANPEQSVQTADLVPWDGSWAYDDTDTDNGTAWRELGFDDSGWAVGQASLGVENDTIPVPLRTPLAFQPPSTHYFRNVFTFDGDPATSTSELQLLIDDGAVAFLNGTEVAKLRLPAQVTHDTFADGFVGEAAFEGPLAIPEGLLQSGANVLAVEVHQNNDSSSDVVFAARLRATENLQSDPAYLAAATVLNSLRVTEIMYNPAGSVDATEEFIEFQNVGAGPIDLGGVRITEGVEFVFPAMALGPGEFVLVVADVIGFSARYGDVGTVAGAFTGRLDNGGETLRIQLAQPFSNNVLCFAYDDDWFEGATDGDGLSLTAVDAGGPIGLWDKRRGWLPGAVPGGTPGTTGPAVITSPLAATGVQGAPFVYQITAANEPLGYGATGLPPGFTVDPDTGTILGTSAVAGLVNVTISATNINGTESETLAITFAPQPPPQVNSPLAVETALLAPFSYQITGTNNPDTFSASGVPNWLSFDPGTGLLSGAAPVPGQYPVTIGAGNLNGSDSETLVITVVTDPLAVAVDSQGLSWRTGGNNPWFAQTAENIDGVDAVQAGPGSDSDDDWIETTIDGPDTLTFWWMIINPGGGFQRTRLTVLLDGNEQDRTTAGGFGGNNAPWEQVTVQIPNGEHVVRWNMNTRGDGGPGFLDQVRLASQANLPQITSPALANGIAGEPFGFQLAAENNPTDFTATPLPDGLSVDAAGLITGTLPAVGEHVVNVAATNAAGSWVDTLTIRVGVPLPQALDTPGRDWTTGGDAPWFTIGGAGAHDGQDAAQSGAAGDGEESWIATQLVGPGTLAFWWDVSSQGGGDLLRFELDGSQQFAISGERGWEQRTVSVPAGTHQARWRFTRDAGGDGGDNAAWLDEVVYTTPDSDGDGLADAWEIEHFGDLSQDGDGDFDGDRSSNADEFAALTDPTDPEERLRIVSVDRFSGESAELTWTSVPGQRYVIQGSTRLDTWTDLSTPIEADGAFTTAFASAPGSFAETVTLVGEDAPARALVPLSDIGELWRGGDEAAFAAAGGDAAWRSGLSGTGFEAGGGDYADYFGIDMRDLMEDQRTSVYLRVPFEFDASATVTAMTLRMRYDDGFAAFLNGVPIASANAPGNLGWQSIATGAHADQVATVFEDSDVTFAVDSLREGTNILAVHGMNDEATSSDCLVEPVLEAEVSFFVDSTRGFWRVIAVGPSLAP